MSAEVEDGKIRMYRTTVNIAFGLERWSNAFRGSNLFWKLLPLSRRRLAAALAGTVGLLLLPGIAGSAPTGLFDVGGYRLYLNCTGKGSPTVVLDIGLGGDGAVWFTVQRSAGETLRVCSYDRAGRFRSDPRPSSEPAPVKLLRPGAPRPAGERSCATPVRARRSLSWWLDDALLHEDGFRTRSSVS